MGGFGGQLMAGVAGAVLVVGGGRCGAISHNLTKRD